MELSPEYWHALDSPKLPIVLLPFATLICITTITCMFDYMHWPVPIEQKIELTKLYGPYVALCMSLSHPSRWYASANTASCIHGYWYVHSTKQYHQSDHDECYHKLGQETAVTTFSAPNCGKNEYSNKKRGPSGSSLDPEKQMTSIPFPNHGTLVSTSPSGRQATHCYRILVQIFSRTRRFSPRHLVFAWNGDMKVGKNVHKYERRKVRPVVLPTSSFRSSGDLRARSAPN